MSGRNVRTQVVRGQPPDSILFPDYADPDARSAVGKDNDRAALRRELEIQDWLAALVRKHGLEAGIHALCDQQTDAGFMRDDLRQVRYFQQYAYSDSVPLVAQVNRRRLARSAGAGRLDPPPGVRTTRVRDLSCFLDVDNQRWQQYGVQQHLEFTQNRRHYCALTNPFPLMPKHMTIASLLHLPQSWQLGDRGELLDESARRAKIRRIVADLYGIAARMKSSIVFFNSEGAGATLPQHLHFHVMEVPPGHGPFPLQLTAARIIAASTDRPELVDGDFVFIDGASFPLPAFRVAGARSQLVARAVGLLMEWDRLNGAASAANLIAATEAGQVVLYVVPRNKFFSRSPGYAGVVGSLEALGELVFSADHEVEVIEARRIDYAYMWKILESVRPRQIDALSWSVGRQPH